MNLEPGLRATIEYEEAIFLLALKKLIMIELKRINVDLKGVGRISWEATLLAKEDLERYNNDRNYSLLKNHDEHGIARRLLAEGSSTAPG